MSKDVIIQLSRRKFFKSIYRVISVRSRTLVLKKSSSRSPPKRSSMILLRETTIASRLWFCSPRRRIYRKLIVNKTVEETYWTFSWDHFDLKQDHPVFHAEPSYLSTELHRFASASLEYQMMQSENWIWDYIAVPTFMTRVLGKRQSTYQVDDNNQWSGQPEHWSR